MPTSGRQVGRTECEPDQGVGLYLPTLPTVNLFSSEFETELSELDADTVLSNSSRNLAELAANPVSSRLVGDSLCHIAPEKLA